MEPFWKAIYMMRDSPEYPTDSRLEESSDAWGRLGIDACEGMCVLRGTSVSSSRTMRGAVRGCVLQRALWKRGARTGRTCGRRQVERS